MSSINEIWKTEVKLHSSPLYDLPLCFHENFSSNQRTFTKSNLSSRQSFESLINRLPSPPTSEIGFQLSTRNDVSENGFYSRQNQTLENQLDSIPFLKQQNNDEDSFDSLSAENPFTTANKKLKSMNEGNFLKRSSRTNEKSQLFDKKFNTSNLQSDFSPITITQFIQDINTKHEAGIEPPKLNDPPRTSKGKSSSHKQRTVQSPSVPKCFQLNTNSNFYENKLFQLNLFDPALFQWKVIRSKNEIHEFCRKKSLISTNTSQTSLQALITYIQSQRQYVPVDYSSWNASFPSYHPLKCSLNKVSSSNEKFLIKNPHGRTGLSGQGLFNIIGPNRYTISLYLQRKHHKNYILLLKNSRHKYELPKTSSIKKTLLCHTLDVIYLDHPLNTDDAWIEMEIILIRNFRINSMTNSWFAIDDLSKCNDIEPFDLNLINFYL
ncbi:unnamed protein product [Adineta ricciae]|uniref:Uncharacterized protein n=1 Tax=Adineta ricciae TaxID=249248 RepID=A0A816FEU9_ADIRI|nr:unnamed protein product [Adineta ricciae]